jgi:hypothetical protein
MPAQYYICLFLLFFVMVHKCKGCSREFDVRRGLSTHKRYCPAVTGVIATSLAKRRRNKEVYKVAKVRRQEEAEILRARQDIREGFAEPKLLPAVCPLILHMVVLLRFCPGLQPKIAITPCISFVGFIKSSSSLAQKIPR